MVSFNQGGLLVNHGTVRAEANTELDVVSDQYACGWATFLEGTVFEGAGLVRFPGPTGWFGLFGPMQVNGTVELDGAGLGGQPVWGGPGLFRWKNGSLGNFTFAPGFQVEASSAGIKDLRGTCNNQGTIHWIGDSRGISGPDVQLFNSGLLLIETNCLWDAWLTLNNFPGGTIRQTGGFFSLGTLNNSGILEIVKGLAHMDGLNMDLNSSHLVDLGGRVAGTDFGQINAEGLTAGGSLIVTLTNGFVPAEGDAFVLATGEGGFGRFIATSLPPLPSELNWRVSYAPNAITLKVEAPARLGQACRLADGSFRFSLGSVTNHLYEIQASTNLVDWVTVFSLSEPSENSSFTDTNANCFERRFYRCWILDVEP